MPFIESPYATAGETHANLEHKTASVLRRLGFDIGLNDRSLVQHLIPFVIDPESLRTVPPLESVPTRYFVRPEAPYEGSYDHFQQTPTDYIRYRNIALEPVPVLAPPLAHLLLFHEREIETEFIDGHHVYGANLFGHHEGRRLLRRAIGYLYDELSRKNGEFDVIAFESDGFLIAKRRAPGDAPLRDQLRGIIARMNGGAADPRTRRAIRDRLATFYRQAAGDVLAPATVAHETRSDLASLLAEREVETRGTTGERFARLQERYRGLSTLIAAISGRPPREQEIVLTLVEHRMYDYVLQRLTHDLSQRGYRVRALREPGELIANARDRSVVFFRLELVSLLKSINEHPLGGFPGGNEALRSIYTLLVTTLQRMLRSIHVDPAYEIHTFRRWGDFYFGLDRDIVEACDVVGTIDDAFASARYVVIDNQQQDGSTPYSVTLLATPSPPAASQIVVPLIPVLTADVEVADDILSMPIEQPGLHKLWAIEKRLDSRSVTDLDIAFLADWTLNACDPSRGIPRLVRLLHATHEDIDELARHYYSHVNRKGKLRYTLRRDARAVQGVAVKLRQLIARSKSGP
jgi:hypothetical protein